MAVEVFFDTSVLLAGLIDFGPQSAPAQSLLHAVRKPMLRLLADDRITGGRLYDVHIPEIARSAATPVIVTDNRRHFLSALRHGLRVETPGEFLQSWRSA